VINFGGLFTFPVHAVMAKRLLPHQPSYEGDAPGPDELDSPAIEAAALDIPAPESDKALQKGLYNHNLP